jgi:preprotein translocase subunit SecE
MTKDQRDAKEENRVVRYFKDTRAEIAKVTWPTAKKVCVSPESCC